MAFGQDFLKAFFGNDYLKDYTHASKTFRTAGYENAPRLKFLFHVYLTVNDSIPALRNIYTNNESATLGLLVKSVDLPRYQIDVETLNQYNRKRLVQKKINYQPITCTFHDDGGDLIRNLWYNYYAYYYKDPNQPYAGTPSQGSGSIGPNTTLSQGFSYNSRDIYENSRVGGVNDWGYVGESYNDGTTGKPPFFRDIQIYGFNQHKYVSYVLVNPMITEWQHDTYDYSQGGGIMENRMTIAYETVKYYEGGIGRARPDTYAKGFANPQYYDQVQSPLNRPGGTQSILGQGGLLDAGIGIYQDLNARNLAGVIGAVQKAGTAYQTFKGKDLKAIAREEANAGLKDVLKSTLPGAIRNQPIGSASINNNGQPPTIGSALRAPLFPTPPKGKQ
jgi:hypothetical protein